jgi:hypothetical protein
MSSSSDEVNRTENATVRMLDGLLISDITDNNFSLIFVVILMFLTT